MRAEHRPRAAPPWKRQRRRPWCRSNDLAPATALLARIPSLPRAELACITARMIEQMGALAGGQREAPDPSEEHSHE